MMKLSVYLLLAASLIGCNSSKKYYYQEGDKEVKEITASSDSAAYLEAYQDFEISKKIYQDMKASLGALAITAPLSFALLNDKKEDITYRVTFQNRDSLEKVIQGRTAALPNSIKTAVTANLEEKNGVGAKYDTGGLYRAPVRVTSARFITKEYSNYKDVSLHYKNVGNKTVSAIRFKWYGENAFNEPADMSSFVAGWGSGFTDDKLRPGKSDYGEWSILSKDGKKILIAYPYEVAFEDGTKWVLHND